MHLPSAPGRKRSRNSPARRPQDTIADARRTQGTGPRSGCQNQERLGVGMMLAYPVHIEPDDNDTFLVTSPDFPELTTFGYDRDEALARAVDAFQEVIAARIYDREDIPCPSQGADCVALPALITAKVMLYQGMRDQSIGKAELARRLGWTLTQVDRATDINHRSRLDDMDAALRAVGCQLTVTALSA